MRRLSDIVDGRGLAIARIGIGLAALINLVEAQVKVTRVLHTDALRMPMLDGLPSLSGVGVAALFYIGVLGVTAVVLGLGTRPAAAVCGFVLVTLLVWEQQVYSNHLVLSAWCLLWLTLSRADARWSLAARVRGPRDVTFSDQLLLMTQLSAVYLFTGTLKINENFLSGRVLKDWSHLDLPDWMWPAMAVGAVIIEVSLAIGLWIPRIRRVVALLGLGLHASIPFVMIGPAPLVSFSLLTISLYPLFLVRSTRAAELHPAFRPAIPMAHRPA